MERKNVGLWFPGPERSLPTTWCRPSGDASVVHQPVPLAGCNLEPTMILAWAREGHSTLRPAAPPLCLQDLSGLIAGCGGVGCRGGAKGGDGGFDLFGGGCGGRLAAANDRVERLARQSELPIG